MRIKTGFRLRTLGREFIITPEAETNINFNKMISLNSSAAYLWQSAEGKDFTVEDLAALLVDRYGIDMELALKDSANIASKWVEAGIVEE